MGTVWRWLWGPNQYAAPISTDGRDKYRAGDPIARGYVDTGDQVFVDKFTYHFRSPHRGDVFVFNTAGISAITMNDPEVKSQFYIKRLAGVAGDKLRVDQPNLYVNGPLANSTGFCARHGLEGRLSRLFKFQSQHLPQDAG